MSIRDDCMRGFWISRGKRRSFRRSTEFFLSLRLYLLKLFASETVNLIWTSRLLITEKRFSGRELVPNELFLRSNELPSRKVQIFKLTKTNSFWVLFTPLEWNNETTFFLTFPPLNELLPFQPPKYLRYVKAWILNLFISNHGVINKLKWYRIFIFIFYRFSKKCLLNHIWL